MTPAYKENIHQWHVFGCKGDLPSTLQRRLGILTLANFLEMSHFVVGGHTDCEPCLPSELKVLDQHGVFLSCNLQIDDAVRKQDTYLSYLTWTST